MAKKTATAEKNETITQIRNLARMGGHARAIELVSQSLSETGLKPVLQMDLLDLRAESHIAQGNLELAAKDAAEMIQIADGHGLNTPSESARATRPPELQAQALNRKALVQMRQGELKAAVASASAAIEIKHKDRAIYAQSLFRQSEALWRSGQYNEAIKAAKQAIPIFKAAGDISGAGRAYWSMAVAYFRLSRSEDSRKAGHTALELCLQADDQYGVGNALTILGSSESDIAKRIEHAQQGKRAFETAGYLERRAAIQTNLALTYYEVGLYRYARRLQSEVVEINRKVGAKLGLAYALWNLLDAEAKLGEVETARAHLQELAQVAASLGDPAVDAGIAGVRGDLALIVGNGKSAIAHYHSAYQIANASQLSKENIFLTQLAHAYMTDGIHAAEALEATHQASTLHRVQDFAKPDGYPSQEIWWRHTQALLANKKIPEARAALKQAHKLLLKGIANVRDEGLRRNYLNKVAANRELLQYWVKDGAKRKIAKKALFAHLAIETHAREPFKRLTDTGLRLNALHTIEAIETFLVEETTELSGAERVMLIREKEGMRTAAAYLLPRGEDAQELLREIEPLLTRTTSLIPPKKSGLNQIVAPLVSQNHILGYLYVDMDALYGIFTEVDRDMLGMLANQAAVALDNVSWAQGLELKVQHRTEELQMSKLDLEQRYSELQIINQVQLGLASKLEVNAIYELIGEQLRSMFDSQGITIASFDVAKNIRHYQYMLEKGQKLDIPDGPIAQLSQHIIREKKPFLINEKYEERLAQLGIISQTLPGTEQTLSLLRVPILVNDEVRGVIGLDNLDRENAFSDSDLHLLTTLANGMSVALESARLYQEAQEARAVADMASKAKSTFLANMSHELRTPLNAIIGFTRIVRRKSENVLPEKQTENLDKILSSGEHLLTLIDAVLDIAKIEAGRMDVHAAKFNIYALVGQCANISAPLVKPGVVLEKNIAEEMLVVFSDQEKVKQILINLLSNAVKFTHAGRIAIGMEKDEASIRISIADSGIGISEEALGQIFGEFQQADASATRRYGGAGLGLAISRNLAHLLNGELTAVSELGKGSTFTLTLPMQYQAKNEG